MGPDGTQPQPRRIRDRARLGAALVAAALVGAGCAPGGGGSDAGPTTSSSPVVTDPAKIGAVSISVLDTWTGNTPLSRFMQAVEAGFMKKYPQIHIKRTSQSFDDLNKTLRLKLSDPSVPDVVPANNGWAGIGDLAHARLILNLTRYAKAYGWNSRFPDSIAQQHEVTPGGTQIGEGDLYGVPIAQGAFIAVYYNRAKLKALGLSVPATLGEFQQDLAAAKQAGQIPIQIGTQDQWVATAALYALQDVYTDNSKIADWVYGTGSGKLSGLGMSQAAATFQSWSRKGYLAPNFAGVTGSDSGQKFVDGQGVFSISYSDSLPFKNQAASNKFGSFLLPTTSGPARYATGATQSNFSIAANSAHPDAAALFLNYISSPAAGRAAVAQGVLPFLGSYTAPAGQPMLSDEISELSRIQQTDGFVPYLDWASSTLLTTLGAQTQRLLADQTTPAALTAAAQSDYDAAQAKR